MLIDLVVSMNLFSEVKANVIHVCQTFKWSIPSDDVLDALITDALNVKLESPKSTPSKARIAYYGIDLTGWDAVSFMESVSQKFPAQVKNLSPVLKSRLSERNEHHITLAARFAHPDLFSEIHTSYQEVKQRRLQDEQDWKRALKRRPTSRGGVSPSFTSENQIIQGIRFGNVVWDDQTLVVTVHLPSHIRCGNPVAHITLATRSDDVLPAYSNTLLHVYKVVGAQDGVHSVDVSGYEIQGTLRHFA